MERGVKMTQAMTTQGQPVQLSAGALAKYVIGAGDLYLYPINNILEYFPTDAEIEIPKYSAGVCSGGFKITDKPKVEKIVDANGNIVQMYVTEENITISTGIVSWNTENVAKLTRATYSTNCTANGAIAGEEVATLTGQGALPIFLLRLKNSNMTSGQTLRFTAIVQPSAGTDFQFGGKETTVKAEVTAIYYLENFLANVRVSAPVTPASTSTPAISTAS
jgi:hypothetical protein